MHPHRLTRAPVVDRERYLVEAARGQTVLHLGCADSPLYRNGSLLHGRLSASAKKLVGIDCDREAVRFLTDELGFENVHVADVERLDEAELGGPFDVVIAGEILEHLPNPGLCLLNVRRALAPGGLLVVTVPNAFSLKGIARVLTGIELVHPDHVAYYSEATVGRLLAMCGYEVVGLAYYSWPPATRVKRLLDAFALRPILRTIAPHMSTGLIVSAKGV